MKTKTIFIMFLISSAMLFAQQNEGAKLQKADESGFIEVDKVPALISKLSPEYPELAKLAGIEGTVYLKLLIDEKGNVAKAKVEQGVKDMLDNSALAAAKKAKFSPAMIKDKPVKVWVVLPIAFKLSVEKTESTGTNTTNTDNEEPDINAFIQYEKTPELVKAETPAYPEIAKKAGIEGKVFVKVLVDKEGSPKKAIVIKSESQLFNQSAVDAALKSEFTPAMQGGKAIAVWIVLPYKFSLGGEDLQWVPKSFDTVEEAIREFNSNIYLFENKENREAIGFPKNINFEKIDENINYGDESALYWVTGDNKTGYTFVARKDKTFYRCGAKNLDGIRKYINDFKKKESKITHVEKEGTEEKLPDLTWLITSKKPEYPSLALNNKIEGLVSFKVLFNKNDMSIAKIDLIKGTNEILDKAALDYVKKEIKSIIEYFDSINQKYYKQHPNEQVRGEIKDAAIIRIEYRIE
ncbi:MAG: hypothetical protein CVV24_09565 [Ignavibacteriae bacterium HGW-Ignavibacteriae-3]|nr:MAG: hypothetical protein CVV24_09565 [Ignavibacteriae bacterium HGW-Ignavibacteriae-3]